MGMYAYKYFSIGIGAVSFNIDRLSHVNRDIDTHYQHFSVEITQQTDKNQTNSVILLFKATFIIYMISL